MRRRATLLLAATGVATGCARIPPPVYTLGAADQFANALILAARENNQDLRGAAERGFQEVEDAVAVSRAARESHALRRTA